MKTDPIRDSVAFLLGASDDHLKLGLWRFGFALLFLLLLAGSVWAARRAWRAFPEQRRAANLLIWLCRVLIGVMWFQGSLWKLPFPVSGGLEYWTQQMVENAAYPFVAGLVQSLALPHMDIVTPLVFALELGLAVAYMLGLFVRPAATLGALYALGLWLGLYRHPGEWPWEYIFLAVLQAQFAIFAAGRRLGLDALWRTRRPDVFREDIPRTA